MATKLVVPSSRFRVEFRRKAASAAIAEGDHLVENGTGEVTPMTNPNEERIAGIAGTVVTSASPDYASLTLIPVIIDEDGTWEFDNVSTGGAPTEAIEGTYIDFADASEKNTVDSNASTYDQVYVTKFISATKLRGKITRWASSEPPATN
jgi:hypothetical protein